MSKKSGLDSEQTNHSEQKKQGYDILQKQILENLVELQKVNINLTEKFDSLSGQISELLKLFELAARSFSDNPAVINSQKDKEFLDKIDRLLDQNKTIAKGLTLMEDRIRERVYGGSNPRNPIQQMPGSGMVGQIQNVSSQAKEDKEDEDLFSSAGKPLPKF